MSLTPPARRRTQTLGYAAPSTLKPLVDDSLTPKRKTLGKDFESELEVACKNIRAWNHSSNAAIPAADRLACVPCRVNHTGLIVGLSMMLEAKECRDYSFDFIRLSDNERKHLSRHADCAGITVVLLKSVCNRPRYFACHWHDWLELENGMGFDPKAKTRRKAGTASVSLLDGCRPWTFIELERVERGQGLGKCLDLSPLIPDGLHLEAV